ncbi:M13 family metallopeptidase [Dyella sp. RRB7]|uniref:M13 family metallopeptidase n=1 Tax=Dyella sp. RRB7 TaxID=2919502 RepID=UPI001FAA5FB8|nr:M13 family metallopeptidase [Dyella sp. RRB7]
MKRTVYTKAVTGVLALLVCATAAATAAMATQGSGIDRSGMDAHVRPGDDFYRYANGAWLDQARIPPDDIDVGVFSQLSTLVLQRQRDILEQQMRDPASRLGMFYASFMDKSTIDAKGATPIMPALDAIMHAPDDQALMRVMAGLQQRGIDGLVDVDVSVDDGNPTAYTVMLRQAPLSLPSPNYYLSGDAHLAAVRVGYRDYLERLLGLAGQGNTRARAQAVLALDADFAAVELDRGAAFDATTTYHPMTATALARQAPGIDWPGYLQALKLDAAGTLVVRHPAPIAAIVKRWSQATLSVHKDWLLLRTLDHYARYLSAPFDDAQFAFYGRALQGTSQPSPRWRRGVSLTAWRMKDALGKAYVERYFPPASKTAAERLAQSILAAYRVRITQNSWMAQATKAQALQKLASIKPLVGYPDHWQDDGDLVVARDDLIGNIDRAEQLDYERSLAKLGKPVDRGEWLLSPTVTVGWSNPVTRIVAFPAALLQPPLFDPQADAAVNYGAIGVLMAHEFTHQFDNNGRHYDAQGRVSDWWTKDDSARYDAQADKLVKQYDSYEPLPGLHANGKLTLSENIADLGGVVISHDAYRQSLGGRAATVIDGLSGEQRFFLGYAQMSREVMRRQVLSNEHSLSALRVDTVRNLDAWYRAFNVAPGEKLYLSPPQRVTIW